LIIDEATCGVDVGAKAEVHELLHELACAGTAILVISCELPEIINLSRRIIVLRECAAIGELSRRDFSPTAPHGRDL
jgi:ABC-type sugar transport system ATPase subunit